MVLETFKMGHGTNFGFSVLESFCGSMDQQHGTGSASWD